MPEVSSVIEFELPSGNQVRIVRRRFAGTVDGVRVSVVAGVRGDAPEGVRVAHRVANFLGAHEAKLRGSVDVYPCANPLAAHKGSRLWPFFDVDLDRRFPGDPDGHPPDRAADALTNDVRGSDLVIEIRGANPAFREVTQAHVRTRDEDAAQLALGANVAVLWVRQPGPSAPATFAHQIPGTIVLEGGAGNRIIPQVGRDLADGVLNLLARRGVLAESDLPFHVAGLLVPARVGDDQVIPVRSVRGGLFVPEGEPWAEVERGDPLGAVIDPSTGETLERIEAPVAGRLLAVREQPVVFPGTLVARVVS